MCTRGCSEMKITPQPLNHIPKIQKGGFFTALTTIVEKSAQHKQSITQNESAPESKIFNSEKTKLNLF